MKGNVSGRAGSSLMNFFNLLRLAFTLKGTISITLILIIINGLTALADAVDEGSAMPFVKQVGGEILNHDNKLYIESTKIEDNGGLFIKSDEGEGGFFKGIKRFWETLKSLGRVALNLWYLWTFSIIFYTIAIYITNNESAKLSNTIMMIIFLVVLQIGANFILIDKEVSQYDFSTKEKFIPFKGLFKFASVAPMIFDPVYGTEEPSSNTTINQSQNLTTEESIVNTINMMQGDDAL